MVATAEEVIETLQNLRDGTFTGSDEISSELLKYIGTSLNDRLAFYYLNYLLFSSR